MSILMNKEQRAGQDKVRSWHDWRSNLTSWRHQNLTFQECPILTSPGHLNLTSQDDVHSICPGRQKLAEMNEVRFWPNCDLIVTSLDQFVDIILVFWRPLDILGTSVMSCKCKILGVLKWPSRSVNFISLVTSCVGLHEEVPQTALPHVLYMGVSYSC